jgi:hypothetical protein
VTENDFAEVVARHVRDAQWPELLALMHGIGLPAGWEDMVRPLFDGVMGKDVQVEIFPAAELPDHLQSWLRAAPAPIKKSLEHAIKLSHETVRSENDKESDEMLLPIVEIEGRWRILLVGGEG